MTKFDILLTLTAIADKLRFHLVESTPVQENASCITYISDISTKPTPLSSPSSAPLTKQNYTSLAELLAELANLVVIYASADAH